MTTSNCAGCGQPLIEQVTRNDDGKFYHRICEPVYADPFPVKTLTYQDTDLTVCQSYIADQLAKHNGTDFDTEIASAGIAIKVLVTYLTGGYEGYKRKFEDAHR